MHTSPDQIATIKVHRGKVIRQGQMKSLIVEDDFGSRLLLQILLSRFGVCHIAVNRKEAIEAFRAAKEAGAGYDLICMDMIPEKDGQAALRAIRAQEEAAGVLSSDRVRVILMTTLQDMRSMITAFKGLCDAYLVKPVDATKLLDQLVILGLIA
jgi:two-component system chemotaxis response regulator CheY